MVDYKTCSRAELESLALQRGLAVRVRGKRRRKEPTKKDYCAALKEADKNPSIPESFPRFLDLLPEIRNQVYDLLLNTGDLSSCHPQITAASKQTHIEASGLIYARNQFEIKISNQWIEVQGTRCKEGHPDLLAWNIQWPTFLRKAQHVLVTLALSDSWDPRYSFQRDLAALQINCRVGPLAFVNHVLYSLCSFLEKTDCVKSFTIDLVSGSGQHFDGHLFEHRCRCRSQALFPLSMLDALRDLIITGLPQDITDQTMSVIRSRRPQSSVYPLVGPVIDSGLAYKEIRDLISNDDDRTESSDEEDDLWKDLSHLVASKLYPLQDLLFPSSDIFMDETWETEIRDRAESLKQWIAALDRETLRTIVRAEKQAIDEKFQKFEDALVLADDASAEEEAVATNEAAPMVGDIENNGSR